MNLMDFVGFNADGRSSRKNRVRENCCLCPTNPRVGTSKEASGSKNSIPEVSSANERYR